MAYMIPEYCWSFVNICIKKATFVFDFIILIHTHVKLRKHVILKCYIEEKRNQIEDNGLGRICRRKSLNLDLQSIKGVYEQKWIDSISSQAVRYCLVVSKTVGIFLLRIELSTYPYYELSTYPYYRQL